MAYPRLADIIIRIIQLLKHQVLAQQPLFLLFVVRLELLQFVLVDLVLKLQLTALFEYLIIFVLHLFRLLFVFLFYLHLLVLVLAQLASHLRQVLF